jgi:hypothetical protein
MSVLLMLHLWLLLLCVDGAIAPQQLLLLKRVLQPPQLQLHRHLWLCMSKELPDLVARLQEWQLQLMRVQEAEEVVEVVAWGLQRLRLPSEPLVTLPRVVYEYAPHQQ